VIAVRGKAEAENDAASAHIQNLLKASDLTLTAFAGFKATHPFGELH
jgi:hypothetical protein